MTDVAKLRILVDTDATSVPKGFALASAATTGWANTTTAAMTKVQGAGSQLSSFWSSLSTGQKTLAGFGIGAALVGTALNAVIGPAIAFESAFAGVKKTVDASPAGLAMIRQGLLDLSNTIPTTANELANIAANAGQLGVKAPQILEFTKTIALLGETTDLDFDASAQSMARFLNVTGNDQPISRLADVLVELGNNSATTESQIVNFAGRLASAFTVAGASEDQILALAASFSSLGLRAEAGGSALSTIITKISDAAKLGGAELNVLAKVTGLLPDQFARIAKESPVEALLLFGEGLRTIVDAGGSVTPTLDALGIGGLRTSEVMRLLALNSDQVRESLALASAQMVEGGAAIAEANARFETTESRLALLQNRITTLAIALGTPLLGTLAQGADLAGDAILELSNILGPLAGEIAELFGNAGEAAAFFLKTLGGPALAIAVAALIGATQVLTGLLDALNALGPAGLVLAGVVAVLTLVPAAASAASFAVFALQYSLATVGVSGTAAAVGMKAFNLAAAAGPLLPITAALVLLGKGLYDAGQAADRAGEQLETAFKSAVAAGDLDAISRQVDDLAVRLQQLDEIDKVSEGWGGGWDSWGTSIKSVGQLLTPFTENTIVNARAEAERLREVARDNGLGTFEKDIERAASRLGITGEATLLLAERMGVLGQLTQGTNDEFHTAVEAMLGVTQQADVLAAQLGVTSDQLLASETSAASLTNTFGLTFDQLERIAGRMENFDFADIFDEDDEVRLEALDRLATVIRLQYEALAQQVGITTSEFESQVAAVENLAASHSSLRTAIEGVQSAMAILGEQARITAEAREAYNTAFENITDVTSLQAAAQAAAVYVTELAGTGAGIREVTQAQAELGRALVEEGVNKLGLTRDAAVEAAAAILGIPTAVLLQIIMEADEAIAAADEIERRARELDEGEYIIGIAVDSLEGEQKIGALKLQAGDLTSTDYILTMRADIANAEEGITFASIRAREYASGDYTAPIRADNSDATAKTDASTALANAYARGTYQALHTADNSDAVTKAAASSTVSRAFSTAQYLAFLRSNDSDAQAKAQAATGVSKQFSSGSYQATLSANNRPAVSSIQEAINKLAGFQNKTVTLTVRNVTINQSITQRATATGNFGREGMIIDRAGVRSFADGGYFPGMTLEQPGAARYYPAAPIARVFAEQATRGEWYIPRDGNRDRQFAILSDAVKELGFGNRFGGSPVIVNAPISIDATGPGMDPQAIGSVVEARVTALFDRVGRDLAEIRR